MKRDFSARRRPFEAVLAGKQQVGTHTVVFDSGCRAICRLSQAQAEGYECLVCKGRCGQGSTAFRPVGYVLGGTQVFVCVRHDGPMRFSVQTGEFLGVCELCGAPLWANDEALPVDARDCCCCEVSGYPHTPEGGE